MQAESTVLEDYTLNKNDLSIGSSFFIIWMPHDESITVVDVNDQWNY